MSKIKLTYRQLARLIINKHNKRLTLKMKGSTFNKLKKAISLEKKNTNYN